MQPELAPNHVAGIKELGRQDFYDGVVFHRVIDGFMAQTGDPTGTGLGGSGKKLKAEFNKAKHLRGTVSMARARDPNSADSRSEERRVGKGGSVSVDLGGRRNIKKKKNNKSK